MKTFATTQVLLFLTCFGSQAQAASDICSSAPPHLTSPVTPAQTPPPASSQHPRYQGIWSWIYDGHWGVGFLQVGETHFYDWMAHTILPLYSAPGGHHVGWLNRGWLERGEARQPVSPFAVLETGYETNSLILMEVRDDGWLALRLTDTAPNEGGLLWAHSCRLDLGEARFQVVLWRDFFQSELASYLLFRSPVPHALRSGPSTDHERLRWIGEEDDLEVLEIEGDWMRVRVFQPGKYLHLCGEGGPWRGKTFTGWVRWWSREKGTWLRFPTRGC